MQKTKCIFIFLLSFTGFSKLYAQDDVLYQRDSVVEHENDCGIGFLSRSEKISAPDKVTLVTRNQKSIKLPAFLHSIMTDFNGPSELQQSGLLDLDGDGKRELLIWNYTNGAHCCDELYIFRNTGINKYQQAAKMYMGDICLSGDNEISYSFYEQFAYFFTCYACAYPDTSDSAPVEMHHAKFIYRKGKLLPVRGDQELRSTINDNLGKLGEQPFEKLADAASQDNGLRKEFAMNLVVFYFSFGKNLVETKKLFTKYYKFPDAANVWAKFVKQLQTIQKNSDI